MIKIFRNKQTNPKYIIENPFKLSSNVYHKIAAKERELISVMVKDFEGPLKKNFETHSNKIQVGI